MIQTVPQVELCDPVRPDLINVGTKQDVNVLFSKVFTSVLTLTWFNFMEFLPLVKLWKVKLTFHMLNWLSKMQLQMHSTVQLNEAILMYS